MSIPGHKRLREVFELAISLDPAQRGQALDEACGGDHELRREVESLLEYHDGDNGLLNEKDAGMGSMLARAAPAEDTGRVDQARLTPVRVGRYTIVRLIGEGGMGVVYEATQEAPSRTVAVKLLHPAAANRTDVARRFKYEAEILGHLRHPGIAHVYDAGVAEVIFDGGTTVEQPFFAMEFIQGIPLTEFAQSRKLDVRARLELIRRVCAAVDHAHMKGFVHRDLKPQNILVNEDGQPKILDFGVARITDSDIRTTSIQTEVGQIIGTIAYMSPEQIAGRTTDVDIRSDVYALGVMLYELLANKLPFDLNRCTLAQAARLIQEEEPTRLRTISTALRGDVETVVAKALEKSRDRRYRSAAELAEDIRRYLHDEPVIAKPTTLYYQLRKLSQRHRGFVAGCALAAITLIVGAIATLTFALKASTEAAKATAINDFLIHDLLESADTFLGRGRDVTVAEVAEMSVSHLDTAFADTPAIEASLRGTLGRVLMRLGRFEVAEAQVRASMDWHAKENGRNDPQTLELQTVLGTLLHQSGKYDEARSTLKDALARRRETSRAEIGEAEALSAFGQLIYEMPQLDEAESIFREAYIIYESELGPDQPETVDVLEQIGDVHYNKRELKEAQDVYTQVLASRVRHYGEEHYKTSVTQHNLAVCLSRLGKLEESEQMFGKAIATRKIVLGEDHPEYADTVYQYSALLVRQRRTADAVEILKQAVAVQRRAFAGDHQSLARTLSYLATLSSSLGRHEEALEIYDEAYPMYCRIRGPESSAAAKVREGMAYVLYEHGSYEESLKAVNEAMELHAKAQSGKPLAIGRLHLCRGLNMVKTDQPRAAEKDLLKAHEILAAEFGNKHRSAQRATKALAEVYRSLSMDGEAERWQRAMIAP
ncbi:MAG: serine/threonine protein kinase [Planctomycetota bacterium]|jgi:serine/threonine protein kinase/Tfp pilus assembly protein PilF